MKRQLTTKKSGFTIIEVVLVLAIAALIFLIVFLAVPALQRNQRDTQRRSDASRALSQLQQYASNHNGQYPTDQNGLTSFTGKYLNGNGSTFNDPQTGSLYNFKFTASQSTQPTAPGDMFYYTNATCDNGTLAAGNGARSIAVLTFMEASGDTYCVNN